VVFLFVLLFQHLRRRGVPQILAEAAAPRRGGWRTVKYEEAYLKDYADPREARHGLRAYFRYYNDERPHKALDYRTPAEAYDGRGGGESRRARTAARTARPF